MSRLPRRKRIFFLFMEIWKDIPGYEGLYQINNLGVVKSLFRYDSMGRIIYEKTLTQHNSNGYLKVTLCKNRISKRFSVHQLIAMAFLNHKPCGFKLVVNHINFIKTDNRVENLEIVTHRENTNRKHLESTSKYVGVHLDKEKNKWRSTIVVNGKQKHLGYFIDEIDAHNTYQKALSELNKKTRPFLIGKNS